MFCSWAAVRVTLLTVPEEAGGLLSVLDVQPVNDAVAAIAIMTTARARENLPRYSVKSVPQSDLFFMIVLGQIRPMPPATAQRLKQRRRVGITIGLRLDEIDAGLLTGLLRA